MLDSLVAFAVYALLTPAMTWPLAARLSTHLIGNGDDMWVHYWNNWWVKQVLQQGGDVFHTPLLFHPTGVSLVYHNFAWINIALWLGLERLTGGIAAYNLVHLIHIPLCGLAMFLLGRRLTRSRTAAFLGGLVYAFWPYRILDVNHPNMVSTEGFPLLMLALIQLVEDDNASRDGVLAGVLVALIGYARWQLLILAGVMVGLYLGYVLIRKRIQRTKGKVAGLALATVVALSLMAPGLYPLLHDRLLNGPIEGLYIVSASDPEQDLLAWVLPQHQHPLGPLCTRLFPGFGRSTARGRYSAFVGYVAVALAVLAAVKRRRGVGTWFWVGLAVFCCAMALGPNLLINGVTYDGVPMPYRLIGWLLPTQMLRHPHRFTALLGLPIGVLVAHGAKALRQWVRKHEPMRGLSRAGIFVPLLGGLILVDYLSIPTSSVTADVPDFYMTIAGDADSSAIVGLPGERQTTERYMYYQTKHGHPLLGGHVSRLPPQALGFASSVPLVKRTYSEGGIDTEVPDISNQLLLLADAGFRYIVIHKSLTDPETVHEWKAYFAMAPRYEDEEVAVYTTLPVAGRDYTVAHELVRGLGLIQTSLSRQEGRSGPALSLEVVWESSTPPKTDLKAQVLLRPAEGRGEEAWIFEISPDRPLQAWSPGAIVRDNYIVEIGPGLGMGAYRVALGLVDGESGELTGQRIDVGDIIVGLSTEGRAVFPIDRRVRASFGERLELLGYGLEMGSDRISVLLHWRAMRRMDQDYKFFVHLCDADTGDLIAQADTMPHDWSFPTSEWRAGEVVSDEMSLPTGGLPPGDYRLLVGVYSPESGLRLPISAVGPGLAAQQNQLQLPEHVGR